MKNFNLKSLFCQSKDNIHHLSYFEISKIAKFEYGPYYMVEVLSLQKSLPSLRVYLL